MEIEIREVIRGRDGLILASKEFNQKYHLVSKYSRVALGDIVLAELMREKDNFAIYNCERIPESRLILKLVNPSYFDRDNRSLAIWNGEELSFESIPDEYIECYTKLYSRYSSGYTGLALVKEGCEEIVWDLIKSSAEKEVTV